MSCEKDLARCKASRVVYCGDANSAAALELREIAYLIRTRVMDIHEIAEYCVIRASDLESKTKG